VALKHLERRDGRWLATTSEGVSSAEAVVLATNVMTADLPGIAGATAGRSFLSGYSVQIATEPLSAAARAAILPQRHACSDTSHLRLRYCRWDAAGRFVIGGPGFLTPPTSPGAMSFRILERAARTMFPALADAKFVHHWAARDTVTLDIIPHLYEPQPGLFCAVGFNGRGLAIGTALGSVLARRILGATPESLPFPTTPASRSPLNLPSALRFYLGRAGRRFRH
jgi:glycine/D-amino acid oxidase-like deaminating enzyme